MIRWFKALLAEQASQLAWGITLRTEIADFYDLIMREWGHD